MFPYINGQFPMIFLFLTHKEFQISPLDTCLLICQLPTFVKGFFRQVSSLYYLSRCLLSFFSEFLGSILVSHLVIVLVIRMINRCEAIMWAYGLLRSQLNNVANQYINDCNLPSSQHSQEKWALKNSLHLKTLKPRYEGNSIGSIDDLTTLNRSRVIHLYWSTLRLNGVAHAELYPRSLKGFLRNPSSRRSNFTKSMWILNRQSRKRLESGLYVLF